MIEPDKPHNDYSEFLPVWQKCRDAAEGERAIKKNSLAYVSKLSGQTDTDYKSYVNRGSYFNATGRTLDALSGCVFRKPMKIDLPPSIKDWQENITLTGEALTDFAETALTETIEVGRGGIFVDMPEGQAGLTVAQAQAQAIRPYLVLYKAENILNWQLKRVGNLYVLFNVWLSENHTDENGDDVQQVRQLTIQNGAYEQVIWKREKGQTEWSSQTIRPTKDGTTFNTIPFYPLAPRKPKMDVSNPPIESLADLNIAHFRNSVDLENGAHVAGLPTPFATGVDAGPDGNPPEIHLGSSTFIMLPNIEAKLGFLQCGSEGFATLEKLMDRKQEQMAALGARMLAPEKKDAEAAKTHEIKRGGETSILSSICGVVERQIKASLLFAAEWQGVSGEISIELNRDFFPPEFTSQDLTAWMQARQAGEISKETFFNVLQYSEWLPEDTTFEDEQARIAEDGPSLGSLGNENASNQN